MARITSLLEDTSFDFVGRRHIAFAVDGLLVVATVLALWLQGLNLGIDFAGGVVVEAASKEAIDVGALRQQLSQLDFGEVAIQNFGSEKDVLIRVQPSAGVAGHEQDVANRVRTALGAGYTFNRIEAVGPKVSNELFESGIIATLLAVLVITVYVAFRFEWQFGVAALLATAHDVLVAVGLYALLQFDFNLTSIAALLLLAGYSVNDTVVVFDRIRENRRKYKQRPLGDIINLSTNQMLPRTFLTSFTTALAIVPLLLFGGEALFGFAATILWGIIAGTYSSVFVASCLLLYLPKLSLGRASRSERAEPAERAGALGAGLAVDHLGFDTLHVLVGEPEVMADLVDEDVSDYVA